MAYYGGVNVQQVDLTKAKAAVLGLYGENDARVNATLPAVDSALKKAGVPWESVVYPGAGLSIALLAAWAIPSVRRDVVDERYLMQGHPARVTRDIAVDGEGEIAYDADGRTWTVGARSWDGAAIAAGTEVAIERRA